MKNKLLFFILILYFPFCNAQNYQCLQTGVKRYYTNGNGYLRGMRIDSVKAYADSTIFFPYHTPRGRYDHHGGTLDSTEGSWLGKRVLQMSSGVFIFDNIWHDSVIIKTQAIPGDTWTFYNDTTSLYYMAELTSIDTMTVLGSLDSIKNILITAHNALGVVTTDPVDSFRIILSKSNGFVQIFDLYTFPYHAPDSAYAPGLDFYLDKSSTTAAQAYSFTGNIPNPAYSLFTLIPFINPTYQQLYDFNVGDVFEYRECLLPDGVDCDFSYMGSQTKSSFYEFDSITNKIPSGSIVKYHYIGGASYPNPFNINYYSDGGLTAMAVNNASLVDTSLMPEEFKENSICYYFPSDTSYCLHSPFYDIVPSYLVGGVNAPFYFEGGVAEESYKLGIGQVYNYNSAANTSWFQIERSQLIYYKKSTNSCGGFHSLLVPDNMISNREIQVFPNPANEECTIKTDKLLEYTINVINMMGQTLLTMPTNNQQETINLSNIPSGVYNLNIKAENGDCVNRKLVVAH